MDTRGEGKNGEEVIVKEEDKKEVVKKVGEKKEVAEERVVEGKGAMTPY